MEEQNLETQSQEPQPEKPKEKPPIPEKILEGHCRLITRIQPNGKTPQEQLRQILLRAYKAGKTLDLKFENFTEDFQTEQLKKALDAFQKRKPI